MCDHAPNGDIRCVTSVLSLNNAPYVKKTSYLFISVPKTWVRQMQLNRGDTVEVIEQQDGSIVVYPGVKENTPEQMTLNVDCALGITQKPCFYRNVDNINLFAS